MRKKLIALILSFTMLFSLVTAYANADWKAEAVQADDYEIVIEEDGAYITKYLGTESTVELPEEIDGNRVVGISSNAFAGNKSVQNIVIPETVKEIGSWAFVDIENLQAISVDSKNESFCDENGVLFNKDKTVLLRYPSLKQGESYEVSGGVVEIAETAFYGTQALKKVEFPSTLLKISRYAFYYSGIESVIMPDSVNEVGESAFLRCKALKSITFSKNVETLAETVLGDCSALVELNLPENLKTIEDCALINCKALVEINFPNGLETIGNYVFSGCNSIVSLVFPDSVKRVGAFFYNVTQDIGSYIKRKINSVFFGNGIAEFDVYSVLVADLKQINISDSNPNYVVIDGVIFSADMKQLILCPQYKTEEEYIIPEGVERIGEYAFYGCGIKTINIPNSVTEIGEYAFRFSSITSIQLPDGIKEIKDGTFSGCNQLENIKFPKNLLTIGESAFSGCKSLKSVEFNEKLQSIGSCAFVKLENLKGIQLPDSLIEIGDRAFELTGITTLSLPKNLRTIGERAFGNCFELRGELIIPDSVVSIGECAFANTEIEELTIGKGVEVIDAYAFMSIYDSEIVIPANVRRIGGSAFGPIIVEKIIFEGAPPADYQDYFCDVLETDGVIPPKIYYYEAYADEWKSIIEKSEYEFIQLDGGEVFIPKGDTNKDRRINSKDIAALQRSILKGEGLENGDITGDGKINSLDISAMQKTVHYGTQYYKIQEKQHEGDNAFVASIDSYLHDKYQKDGVITVKSREGFEFLPEKYDEAYFKENKLMLLTLPQESYVVDYATNNIVFDDLGMTVEVTKNIRMQQKFMDVYFQDGACVGNLLVAELNQKTDTSNIEIMVETGMYAIYPPIT